MGYVLFLTLFYGRATAKHIRGALCLVWSVSVAPPAVGRTQPAQLYILGPTLWVIKVWCNFPKVPELDKF